jgi:hypothetical protein
MSNRIIDILKTLGYSKDIPQFYELIERMEAYVAAYNEGNLFSAGNSALSDMPFALDTTWMGFFPAD